LVAIRCSRRSSIHFTDQEVLGIELAAHAEAAADIELDHVDGVLADAQHGGEHPPIEEQHLRGTEYGQPSIGPLRDHAAGLHRQGGEAVGAERLAPRVFG
jgi:hypothetical protein